MRISIASSVGFGVLFLCLLAACGETARRATPDPEHPLLGTADEVGRGPAGLPAPAESAVKALDALYLALEAEPVVSALVIVQPADDEVLEADLQPPRFLWRDPVDGCDTWWVGLRFEAQPQAETRLLVLGSMPAEAVFDPLSAGLHAWTPSPESWAHIVEHGAGTTVVVTLVGFAAEAPDAPLSKGSVRLALGGKR